MKDEGYINIQGWMANRLGLSGNKLLTYAVIYGFSQDEKSEFCGSLEYLAKCLGTHKNTVFNILKELEKAKLIERKEYILENGFKAVNYRAIRSANPKTAASVHHKICD